VICDLVRWWHNESELKRGKVLGFDSFTSVGTPECILQSQKQPGQATMCQRDTKSEIVRIWRKLRAALMHLQQTVSPAILCQLVECELEDAEAMYKLDSWSVTPIVKGPHEIIYET
jgi:hypothetical protein